MAVKRFALLVILLLVNAYAVCDLSDFKSMGQELGIISPAKSFWKNTMGWQANEINELNANDLLFRQNKTELTTPGMFSVRQIAGLLGKDPEEVAEEIGESPDAILTEAEIRELAKEKPGGFLDQFLGTKTKVPTKEEYLSVKMPNGKVLRLKEVYDRMGYGDIRDSCTLDHSFINGKVSFIALLNKDLRIGYTRSTKTTETGQHLTSTKTAFSVNLNGGDTFILPHTFEKISTGIGMINSIDLILGAATAAYGVSNAKQGKAELKNAMEERQSTLVMANSVEQALSNPIAVKSLAREAVDASEALEKKLGKEALEVIDDNIDDLINKKVLTTKIVYNQNTNAITQKTATLQWDTADDTIKNAFKKAGLATDKGLTKEAEDYIKKRALSKAGGAESAFDAYKNVREAKAEV